MINLDEVLHIHEILINNFGGAEGIRDINLLKSAIDRPFTGFGETEFYKTAEEKSAALVESIVKNHPFIDGNKRTGYVLMRLLLLQNGKDLKTEQSDKYQFIIQIASGHLEYDGILSWIHSKVISI